MNFVNHRRSRSNGNSEIHTYGEKLAAGARWVVLLVLLVIANARPGSDWEITQRENLLLAGFAALNLVVSLVLARGFEPTSAFRRATMAMDVGGALAVLSLSGGGSSPFFGLCLLVVISAAFRFDTIERLAYAALTGVAYGLLAFATASDARTALQTLFARLSILALAAVTGSLLADQERAHRRGRQNAERRLAETEQRLEEVLLVREVSEIVLHHLTDRGRILADVAAVVRRRVAHDLFCIALYLDNSIWI
jgi:hypothetical protein